MESAVLTLSKAEVIATEELKQLSVFEKRVLIKMQCRKCSESGCLEVTMFCFSEAGMRLTCRKCEHSYVV